MEKENNKTINNTINNNNINLVAFGEEDFAEVTDSTMKKIMKCGLKALPQLFQNIHFNKLRPQYKNICINNLRDSNITTYDGTKWKLVDRVRTLEDIIERYEDAIENRYYKLEEELDEITIRRINIFIDKYCEKENTDMYKKELTLLLYNNKDLINAIKE